MDNKKHFEKFLPDHPCSICLQPDKGKSKVGTCQNSGIKSWLNPFWARLRAERCTENLSNTNGMSCKQLPNMFGTFRRTLRRYLLPYSRHQCHLLEEGWLWLRYVAMGTGGRLLGYKRSFCSLPLGISSTALNTWRTMSAFFHPFAVLWTRSFHLLALTGSTANTVPLKIHLEQKHEGWQNKLAQNRSLKKTKPKLETTTAFSAWLVQDQN